MIRSSCHVHGEFSVGSLDRGFQDSSNLVTNPAKERALNFRIFKDLDDIPEIAAGQLVLAEGSTGAASEMAIIEQSTRRAEILALTDVTVVMLDETLSRRIRRMNAKS